jgi:hypothetical protein
VTRARKPSQRNLHVKHDTAKHDTVKSMPVAQSGDEEPLPGDATALDGPRVARQIHFEDSVELLLPDMNVDDDEYSELTVDRGSKPPRPSSSRRLSPTLMQIFKRRREQIGISLDQIARLTGVEQEELERFEGTNGAHRLLYDHAVVVMRVLGLKPTDLPGMRVKDGREDVRGSADELQRSMVAGPMLTFEGQSGERYGGDIDRVLTTPAFTVKIGDDSLAPTYPRGALLLLRTDGTPGPTDVALLRHKRSKTLALRRLQAAQWLGLAVWQPPYPKAPEWVPVARVQVVLPRPAQ